MSPRLYVGNQDAAKAIQDGVNRVGITHAFDCRGVHEQSLRSGRHQRITKDLMEQQDYCCHC